MMSNLDETSTKASKGCSILSYTISRFIGNLHVHQASRKRLRVHMEPWLGSWCPILMKLLPKLPKDDPSYLTPSPCSSGTSMSSKDSRERLRGHVESWLGSWCPSKTPRRDLKRRESWPASGSWILVKLSWKLEEVRFLNRILSKSSLTLSLEWSVVYKSPWIRSSQLCVAQPRREGCGAPLISSIYIYIYWIVAFDSRGRRALAS